MNFELAITLIGPIVLVVNIVTMFLCFRPKYGLLFTILVFAVCAAAIQFIYNPIIMRTAFAPYGGVIIIPVMMLLFRGQPFQKLFAFFMGGQLSSLNVSIANLLVNLVTSTERPDGQIAFFVLSMLLLCVYLILVLRFGRRFFERLFVDDRTAVWVLYSFGAAFSFFMLSALQWPVVGALLYIALTMLILISFGILCYTVITTHEKTAGEHRAGTLSLQMSAMREQTANDRKHREDMEILRHDMRHEMGVIMELYRTGRTAEAEAVYADWQTALTDAMPALLCAEPVLNAILTRSLRRAKDRNIHMYMTSNIPGKLPLDTIKLSVMVANALENALAATDKVSEDDKRVIRVKLLQSGNQIGLEVINHCAAPVEFDEEGLPVTNELGHGIGVRSIATFAQDNDCMLDFSNIDGKFTMRLVMKLGMEAAGGMDTITNA